MRGFLVLILALALLLPACGAGNKLANNKWGNLQVALENIQQQENQWSANLAVKNPTEKMQNYAYQGTARYTLVISREGKEVLRQDFDPIDPSKAHIHNLGRGVTKDHVVVWTFRDQEGKRVPPGTYQATVTLNATTVVTAPNKTIQTVYPAPTLGPVTITVK
ncbi:MAG: hypothetical protein ACOY93_12600 [Bacillota bacterium]